MPVCANARILLSAFLVGCLFWACNQSREHLEASGTDNAPAKTPSPSPPSDLLVFRFNYAIANIPSAQTILADMEKFEMPYREGFMAEEKIMSEGIEESEKKSALLIGINNADIVYALINKQNGDLIKRMNYALTRIDRLGLSTVMTKENIENLSKSGIQRDSMAAVLDRLSINLDRYLRDNKRVLTASLIFAGSWTEALYLMVKTKEICSSKTSQSIQQYLYDQKVHIDNLIKLLAEIKNDPDVKQILQSLEILQTSLHKIKDPEKAEDLTIEEFKQQLTEFRNRLLVS